MDTLMLKTDPALRQLVGRKVEPHHHSQSTGRVTQAIDLLLWVIRMLLYAGDYLLEGKGFRRVDNNAFVHLV